MWRGRRLPSCPTRIHPRQQIQVICRRDRRKPTRLEIRSHPEQYRRRPYRRLHLHNRHHRQRRANSRLRHHHARPCLLSRYRKGQPPARVENSQLEMQRSHDERMRSLIIQRDGRSRRMTTHVDRGGVVKCLLSHRRKTLRPIQAAEPRPERMIVMSMNCLRLCGSPSRRGW